ncbi:MAG TPA: adenylyltransferase/cytidyltransferase family protein [Patescibacteria group bacterium]
MRKILVFGAFDGIHPGHLNFFKQARKYGDFLIVSIGTDKNVKKIKGQNPLFNQDERLELIKNCKLVDQTVIGSESNYFDHIKYLAPDVICLGYDQWATRKYVVEELKKVGLVNTLVVRLDPYKIKKAKSSIMKVKSVDLT